MTNDDRISPTRHDWRGRPYTLTVDKRDPLTVRLVFWTDGPNHGPVPRVGDSVILRHSEQDHGACYEVTKTRKALAEGDVHGLTARFTPRSQDEIAADVAVHGPSKPKPVVL